MYDSDLVKESINDEKMLRCTGRAHSILRFRGKKASGITKSIIILHYIIIFMDGIKNVSKKLFNNYNVTCEVKCTMLSNVKSNTALSRIVLRPRLMCWIVSMLRSRIVQAENYPRVL